MPGSGDCKKGRRRRKKTSRTISISDTSDPPRGGCDDRDGGGRVAVGGGERPPSRFDVGSYAYLCEGPNDVDFPLPLAPLACPAFLPGEGTMEAIEAYHRAHAGRVVEMERRLEEADGVDVERFRPEGGWGREDDPRLDSLEDWVERRSKSRGDGPPGSGPSEARNASDEASVPLPKLTGEETRYDTQGKPYTCYTCSYDGVTCQKRYSSFRAFRDGARGGKDRAAATRQAGAEQITKIMTQVKVKFPSRRTTKGRREGLEAWCGAVVEAGGGERLRAWMEESEGVT